MYSIHLSNYLILFLQYLDEFIEIFHFHMYLLVTGISFHFKQWVSTLNNLQDYITHTHTRIWNLWQLLYDDCSLSSGEDTNRFLFCLGKIQTHIPYSLTRDFTIWTNRNLQLHHLYYPNQPIHLGIGATFST